MERRCGRESPRHRAACAGKRVRVVVGCALFVSSAAEPPLSLDTWRKPCAELRPLVPSSVARPCLWGREIHTAAQQDRRTTQVSGMKRHLLTALLFLLTTEEAEALREPEICYVLDGILFVYGVILTFLYCRLKIQYRKKSKASPSPIYEKVEGVYTGLSIRDPETYTTIELPKRNLSEHPSSRRSEIQSSLME